MTDTPRISVVIPSYNSERYIAQTLQGVLDQTVQDFEIIVTDDASADRSLEIVAGFDDPRIRVFTNERNVGAVGNWNRGMAHVRGRYAKLLCADDILYPTCLERQAAVLDDPAHAGVSLVCAPHDVVDEQGNRILARGFRGERLIAGRDAVKTMVRRGTNFVGEPSGTMFRMEAYRATGDWDDRARYVVDLDMWMRLLVEGDLYVCGDTLSAFRVQRGSWSNALSHTQTSDTRDLFQRMVPDERYGVTTTDAVLGSIGAWTNAQLRKVFYRVFLRDADISRLGD